MVQKQEYVTFGRQVGYVFAAQIAILLLGLAEISILTKGLGAASYGIWSLIQVTITLVVPFATLSFGMSIVRFLAAEKNEAAVKDDFFSACSIVFITGTIFSIGLFLLSDFLAVSVFKDADASSYIKLASVLILLTSLHGLPLAFFRMRRKIGLYSILYVMYPASQVILILAALLLGYELTGAIVALIIAGILSNLINILLILKEIGFHLPRFSHMRAYLHWGLPLTVTPSLMWILHLSDRYIVSYFIGVAAAGIYTAVYKVGDYASLALGPLGIVLYPAISKLYDEGKLDETKRYIKYALKYEMMIAIPSALGLSILAKPLIGILTTPEFIAGSAVVPFVAFSSVLNTLFRNCAYSIHLVKKTYWMVRFLITSALLNIALNILLIPRMGIIGAAIATLISYLFLSLFALIVTRRYLKFDLSLSFMLKSVLSSVAMALCIWLINPASITSVVISILLGALVYFAVLFLIRGFSKQEIDLFTHFTRDNLKKIGI